MKKNKFYISLFLGIMVLMTSIVYSAEPQKSKKNSTKIAYTSELIFPIQNLHVHSSSIIELPNGDLLSCWFEGSGERTANDVQVKGARLRKGSKKWTAPFVLADTPGQPDCNPVLFINQNEQLFLFWLVVQANSWETSILKYKTTSDYKKDDAPNWRWQDIILLKPGEEFPETINTEFRKSDIPELAWAEYAPLYEKMIFEAAKDPKKRETGWMTRTHPTVLSDGRILLPLYSDGYNLSLMAISDDGGKNWIPSLPIVGRGNVQPSVVQKTDGSLVAYMRDGGDAPGRIQISSSSDNGSTWSFATKTDMPNPGASIEALVLENKDWILIHNNTEDGRHSLVVSLSDDEGKTWKWTKILDKKDQGTGSFAYPSVIQSKDGLIHVTYSYHLAKDRTIKHAAFTSDWIKNKN